MYPFSHAGSTSLEQCITLAGNLYACNRNNRVTRYNFDEDTYAVAVIEDGILNLPKGLIFLNNDLMLVSQTSNIIVRDLKQ